MSPLTRKLLRDVASLRGTLLAIALVVACGVAAMVTMGGMEASLVRSQIRFYDRYRFADGFVHVRRAPLAVVEQLRTLPGIASVDARITGQAQVDLPPLPVPGTAVLVSVPDDGRPLLNDIHLREGRWFDPSARHEVVISEAFAQANGFRAGERIAVTIRGRRENLQIVGIGLSPEFVYEVPPGSLFPDNRRFGVFWMPRRALAAALDLEGAFNDLVVSFSPGAVEADVLASLDQVLTRYGSQGARGRDDQISHRFLTDEIAQHRVSGVVTGYIFISIAAFLLHLALSRLVAAQREQIATLKAFGYPTRTVAWHYLQLAAVPVVLGAVVGAGLGSWFGALVAELFERFYRFPSLGHLIPLRLLLEATAIAGLGALAGALGTVRRVVHLRPAEALRPEVPAHDHSRRGAWLGTRLPVPERMILRGLLRHPVKAGLTTLGLGLAVAMVVLGRYFDDAITLIADVEFHESQRQETTVTFVDALGPAALHAIARMPGVLAIEPWDALPVRLRAGPRVLRASLLARPAEPDLHRVVDGRGVPVRLPDGGILLSTRVADRLRVHPGDGITVEVLDGTRPIRQVPVAGVLDSWIGAGAWMTLEDSHRLLGTGVRHAGVVLAVDPLTADHLHAALARQPGIMTVTLRSATLRSFEETIAESMTLSRGIMLTFAIIIAMAVVYNEARITLSARTRELASLRVLGFTRAEVTRLLLGEQIVLTLLAIPVGCLLGYGLVALLSVSYETDLLRLPLVVRSASFVRAGGVVLVAVLVSGVMVRRLVHQLDLVAVLKTRE